jgi:hypothetical protein
MSGLSRFAWSLLDQLTSDDLQSSFRLQARDVLDALRYLVHERPTVLGGLTATGTAGGVLIAPGLLLQPYPGGSTAPRTDESPFVLGRRATNYPIGIATAGSDTWHLVQARAAEVEISGTRMRYVPGEGYSSVSTTIAREQQLEINSKAGSPTAIPTADPGYVPLCAVLRRAAGGAVPLADIIDLRPLRPPEGDQATGFEQFERQDYALLDGLGATLQLDVELVDRAGLRLSARGTTSIAAILAPGTTIAVNSWLYLYLAPWQGQAVASPLGKGVLVLSTVEPSEQGGRANVTDIALPTGMYSGNLAPGMGTCIGALYTRSAFLPDGRKWLQQFCQRGEHRMSRSIGNMGIGASVPQDQIPRNARTLLLSAYTVDSLAVGMFAPASDPVPTEAAYFSSALVDGATISLPPMNVHGADPNTFSKYPPTLTISEGGILLDGFRA